MAKKLISMRLDDQLITGIDMIAASLRRTRSDMVRVILEDFVLAKRIHSTERPAPRCAAKKRPGRKE